MNDEQANKLFEKILENTRTLSRPMTLILSYNIVLFLVQDNRETRSVSLSIISFSVYVTQSLYFMSFLVFRQELSRPDNKFRGKFTVEGILKEWLANGSYI